jgi:LCP family protein required for cell wall assembly
MNDLYDSTDGASPLRPFDDPDGFALSPDLLVGAKARGRHLRRRRRAVAATAAVPALAVLALGGAAAYVDHRTNEVKRVDIRGGVLDQPAAGQPFNILVVGTDGPRDQADVRTDTIMVVHVDEAANHVSVMSIPRDLVWTTDDPRIDTVLGTQGPQALIEQVEAHLGIPIAHYVAIDEPGLATLIDQVGGVKVDLDAPVRDLRVGLSLPAGCSTLDGATTVELVRSRYLEKYDSAYGTWITDPTSDLGREVRQQVLLELIGRKLLTMPVDSSSFTTLLDVFADHTTVDTGFSRSDMIALARWGDGLTPDDVSTSTPPVVAEVLPSGADVLLLAPGASSVVQGALGGTGTVSQPPSSQASGIVTTPPNSLAAC